MGTGGTTAHASYVISPTELVDGVAEDSDPSPTLSPGVADALKDLSHCTGTDWLDDAYTDLLDAAAGGLSDADDQAIADALNALTPEQLQHLAHAHGFAYPELVGISGTSPHPLAHWLHPTKGGQAIADLAHARYDELAAGGTIGGLTYADLHPPEPPPPDGMWQATPEQFTTALAQVTTLAVQAADYHAPDDVRLALVQAENHLQMAHCPAMGASADQAKAAMSDLVTKTLVKGHISDKDGEIAHQVMGEYCSAASRYLSPSQQLTVLRKATPEDTRDTLLAAATQRLQTVTDFTEASEALKHLGYENGKITVADCSGLPAFSEHALAITTAYADYQTWQYTAGMKGSDQQAVWQLMQTCPPEQLTPGFRAWAKGQPLSDLRGAAVTQGLSEDQAKAATRAQIQNYLASTWDKSLDTEQIVNAITPKSAPPQAVSKKSVPQSASPAPSAAQVAPRGRWSSGHATLMAALTHAAASHHAVPTRLDDGAVAGWGFGPGTAANLGGVHAKTLHTGPDGNSWMFKPDKSFHGARAAAEASASKALAAVGVPSIPVYVASIGGKRGSVQPLMKGATHVTSSPSSWSQADVDAIVRYHVAAWAVGDHDGKPDNMLRTAHGGLVPIDQGAAFKYYGTDKLTTSFSPQCTTIFQIAYSAQKSGGLAKGVTVNPAAAHPVIKQFEAMPDAQWRALLHSTAHEGAKHGVAWVPAMRSRAATQHGVPTDAVTDAQIAEAFLDHAVERKHTLRSDFATFFATDVGIPNVLDKV